MKIKKIIIAVTFISTLLNPIYSFSEEQSRARDLGIPFHGTTGPLNAITDVKGVEVGQVTLFEGNGALIVGKGPIRTGVTSILPRGKNSTVPVFGAWFTLNASGEMTGTTWLEERGLIDGPISITNTHSVGVVRDASVAFMVNKGWKARWHAPVVAETYDGVLNDINGFHVTKEHALEAMNKAQSGPVEEGVVGGGTGMICNGYKGGIGTSSRTFELEEQSYTLGVLVQCNYGNRRLLRIAGKPIEELTKTPGPCYTNPNLKRHFSFAPYCEKEKQAKVDNNKGRDGSIIIVVATDAPLLPHQLKRLIKRPSLALGRLGAVSSGGSGDIFIAFSTAGGGVLNEDTSVEVKMFPNNTITTVFEAVIDATEEAVVNAMVAAKTTIGVAGIKIEELPKDQISKIFNNY
ncbi:MAG: DmpA family aminopeptidase [Sphingomonadales bacterium]